MFDYGLNMAIKGAAYATVLSQTVSVLMMLWKLCSKTNDFRWRFLDFSFDMESIKQIGSIGIAAFTRQILPSFSITFLIRSASIYGTAMVAAMGISKKALRIITGVFAGYSHGMQPFFSFNYGARNSKRIVKALSISRSFVICIGVATSIVFWFYSERIALLFGNNLNTIQYCGNMMKGYALSIPVLGIYHVYASALQAFGKKKASMILSSIRQGLFYNPIVIILPRYFCQSGLYLSQPFSDWLTFALLIYLCRNISKEILEL